MTRTTTGTTIRLSLLALALPALLAAQSVLTVTGTPIVRPGQTVTATLGLTSTVANPVAGIQWTIGIPTGYTATAVIGTAGTAAAKTLYCTADKSKCLIAGANQNAIANGPVAGYTIPVPARTAAGLVQLPLSGLEAGGSIGLAVPLVSGPAFSFRVAAKADLDLDGDIDSADVQSIIDQALGLVPCTGDQNGDGNCKILDVLIVIFSMNPPIALNNMKQIDWAKYGVSWSEMQALNRGVNPVAPLERW